MFRYQEASINIKMKHSTSNLFCQAQRRCVIEFSKLLLWKKDNCPLRQKLGQRPKELRDRFEK